MGQRLCWLPKHGPRRVRFSGRAPHVFCVCDGQPVARGDYYREVARLIGADPPQFVTPAPDSPAAARATADRRISKAKLKQKLKYEFAYPSYREGLAAILRNNT